MPDVLDTLHEGIAPPELRQGEGVVLVVREDVEPKVLLAPIRLARRVRLHCMERILGGIPPRVRHEDGRLTHKGAAVVAGGLRRGGGQRGLAWHQDHGAGTLSSTHPILR